MPARRPSQGPSGWLTPTRLAALAGCCIAAITAAACRPPASPIGSAGGATHAEGAIPPPATAIPASRLREFAGSDACAECHPEIAEQFRSAPHANTLARADSPRIRELFQQKSVLADAQAGLLYSSAVEKGKPTLRVTRKDGARMDDTVELVVGSGRQGMTFLLEEQGNYMEGRASYFPPQKRWWWTFGQEAWAGGGPPLGSVMDPERTRMCFLCHSTAVVEEQGRILPEKSIFNVGCERCHGPGRAHVEAARVGKPRTGIYSLKGLTGETAVRQCGDCHRKPDADSGADPTSDPHLPRFTVTSLKLSQCFLKSDGKLTCVSCHDPHQARSRKAVDYEKVCLSCHAPSRPKVVACPKNPSSGCVGCHMPVQVPNPENGVRFADHWIRTHPEAKPGGISKEHPPVKP